MNDTETFSYIFDTCIKFFQPRISELSSKQLFAAPHRVDSSNQLIREIDCLLNESEKYD